jgi:iron complex transport system substrate-binding protein
MHRRIPVVGLIGLALVAACGSEAGSGASSRTTTAAATTAATTAPATTVAATTTSAAPTFPVTIKTASGDVTIDRQPTRIVSLSPTATETLFAIGAGDQVIAVDEQSNYPAEAPKTDLSGYTPNLEAIVGYQPDLVVASLDPGGLVDGLKATGVPVVIQDAAVTLDDTYTQIEQLGAATGRVGDAAEVVANMKSDIDELVAGVTKPAPPLSYYHELDDTLYTVTSTTFLGNIYALAGLENIADAADKDGSGYPQLSAEFLLQANPELIFLADTKCCGQSAETVAARPGWSALQAVELGNVIPLDDDIASRWGPRVVDLLEAITTAVAKVPAPTG